MLGWVIFFNAELSARCSNPGCPGIHIRIRGVLIRDTVISRDPVPRSKIPKTRIWAASILKYIWRNCMKFEFEIYMKRLEIEMENCMNGNRKTVKLIVWGPSRKWDLRKVWTPLVMRLDCPSLIHSPHQVRGGPSGRGRLSQNYEMSKNYEM